MSRLTLSSPTSKQNFFGSDLNKVSNFQSELNSFVGFFEMNVGLPTLATDQGGMRIMNISDLNNDQSNDIVTIDATGQNISVFNYDVTNGEYINRKTFALPDGYFVDNIIPTSIPQALQHLIVVASSKDSKTGIVSTKLFYYK
jgi:hypothetical protein